MEKYFFEIAGIKLTIEGERKYIYGPLFDFESDSAETGADSALIRVVGKDMPVSAGGHADSLLTSKVFSVSEDEEFLYVSYNNPAAVTGYTVSKNRDEACIYLSGGMNDGQKDINLMYAVRDSFFCFLQRHGKIAVHSASIIYRDKVWLFAAPSGTGKSTHVRLWSEQVPDVRNFNGDVAAVYTDAEGRPMAAGLPWCGTSCLYVNETHELGGVIFLERAEQNELVSISALESITALTARCVTPAWNQAQAALNIQTAMSLFSRIKTARLKCTPTVDAVTVARNFIEKGQ